MNATTPYSCCGPECCNESTDSPSIASAEQVHDQVRAGYARIAASGSLSHESDSAPQASGCGCSSAAGGCCGSTALSAEQVATAVGYAHDDLSALPEGANMGLSCGNPTAIASLRSGEVVLDLGSGGGFDCYITGPKVGASGRVIGVDMTPEMISRSRRNLDSYRRHSGLDNVEFRLSEIEHLPVADASVDVVISNCVLNLSPEKAQVWREIGRVLKPGGRVAVSDLALLRSLPEAVRADVEALVGCIAGAVLIDETRVEMEAAGLTDILLTPRPEYIEAMTDWQDSLYLKIVESLPEGTSPADFITSLDISARKPA